MMNYLDELNGKDTPTAETTREQQKHLAAGWVANGDFLGSLQDALQLWDAVSALCIYNSGSCQLLTVQIGLRRREDGGSRSGRAEDVGRGE